MNLQLIWMAVHMFQRFVPDLHLKNKHWSQPPFLLLLLENSWGVAKLLLVTGWNISCWHSFSWTLNGVYGDSGVCVYVCFLVYEPFVSLFSFLSGNDLMFLCVLCLSVCSIEVSSRSMSPWLLGNSLMCRPTLASREGNYFLNIILVVWIPVVTVYQ